MRTRVTRSFSFEAAHELPWHPGKCRRLHGDNHRFEVTVEGPVDERGVVVDFDDLARLVDAEVVRLYDHRFLANPTAGPVAADVRNRPEAAGSHVVRVRLWETPDSSVELLAH